MKEQSLGYFLSLCRRFIPPSDELLERFNLVVSVYGHLLDSKTKKPLLRREALNAVERLRVHIKTGCISNSAAISLYFEKGKDHLTGVTLYRCARGTNDLKGFHKHMRSLVEWCVGAGLGSDLLLELIYRWNLDRSISNRGLDGSIGSFYDQSVIEAIQKMSWSLFGKATFSDWIPTGEFADTGERGGFEKSESGLGLSSPHRRHASGKCKEF
ncbi:unnamed protein product [Ascophyllum nodosum]